MSGCKEEHDDEGCDLLPGKRDSSHLSPHENGKNKSKKVKSRLNKSRLNFCFSTTPCCVSDKL